MQRSVWTPVHPQAGLVAFLQQYMGEEAREDVGPVIGQAALLCEYGPVALAVPSAMQAEVNAALAGAPSRLESDAEPMRDTAKRTLHRHRPLLHASRPTRSSRHFTR